MATVSQIEQGIKIAQAQNKPELVQRLRTAMQTMLSKGWYRAHASQNYEAQGAIAQKLKQYDMRVMPASDSLGLDQQHLGDLRQRAIAENTSAPINFAQGVVHGAASPFTGTAQSLTHAFGSDEAADAVDKRLKSNERAFETGAGSTTSGAVGDVVGEILPYVFGGAELKAAGLVPKVSTTLGKLGSLALGGAAIGATSPVTGGGDYASEKAKQIGIDAATGPVLFGAGKALGAAGKGARNLTRLATEGGR